MVKIATELINQAVVDLAEHNRLGLSKDIIYTRLTELISERNQRNLRFSNWLYDQRLRNLHKSDWKTE